MTGQKGVCEMAKRSCRRTLTEDRIHEKAVKVRKMTDEQLVSYIEDRVEKARSEGFNKGKKTVEEIIRPAAAGVKEFLDQLRTSKIPGIGAATINKITKAAEEYGYIQ